MNFNYLFVMNLSLWYDFYHRLVAAKQQKIFLQSSQKLIQNHLVNQLNRNLVVWHLVVYTGLIFRRQYKSIVTWTLMEVCRTEKNFFQFLILIDSNFCTHLSALLLNITRIIYFIFFIGRKSLSFSCSISQSNREFSL